MTLESDLAELRAAIAELRAALGIVIGPPVAAVLRWLGPWLLRHRRH
jgi:hypothetical protein